MSPCAFLRQPRLYGGMLDSAPPPAARGVNLRSNLRSNLRLNKGPQALPSVVHENRSQFFSNARRRTTHPSLGLDLLPETKGLFTRVASFFGRIKAPSPNRCDLQTRRPDEPPHHNVRSFPRFGQRKGLPVPPPPPPETRYTLPCVPSINGNPFSSPMPSIHRRKY